MAIQQKDQLLRLAANCALIVGIFCSPTSFALDADIRLKAFGTLTTLPAHDLRRQQAGTPLLDTNFDVRVILRHTQNNFEYSLDHSTILLSGDSLVLANSPQNQLDQTPLNDDRRLMDLTWRIENGKHHQSLHRLDRLAVNYRLGDWSATVGRQALSWGSGLVFQPMDLFNPFAPTAVDKDYKTGDDMVLLERVFDSGNDLQLLTVARRNIQGDVTGTAGSAALKWHGFVASSELELVIAKHHEDKLIGLSYRFPIGGALVRTDMLATRVKNHVKDWVFTGIVNMDYSFDMFQRPTYVFAEYFHNGFGVKKLESGLIALPNALLTRITRGELFNLMRDYAALGIRYEWHPLINHSLTVITNLHDSSSLAQAQLTFEPGDHQRLEVGLVAPLGRRGDEYGGVPLIGSSVTAGGGRRFYFRWSYFF